jgi:hypothetical protein
MAGQKRQLGGSAGEAFECGEAMVGGELADCIHPRVQRHRRDSRTGVADFGDTQTDLRPDVRERVGCHGRSSW